MKSLKIVEIDNVPIEKMEGQGVEGDAASRQDLLDGTPGAREFLAAIVTYPPGVRLNWHMHDHEQVIYILSGRGIVSTTEEERVVTPGTIISIAAGERHWHGATKDSNFSHLYLLNKTRKTTLMPE